MPDLTPSQVAALQATLNPPLAANFQDRVHLWVRSCFGDEIAYDVRERCQRFLEEALELVQTQGFTARDAYRLVSYVFGRPVGEPRQELGGVMVTLAALSQAIQLNMLIAGEIELSRIHQPEIAEKIRKKQAQKPKDSPLPGPSSAEVVTRKLPSSIWLFVDAEGIIVHDEHGTPGFESCHAREQGDLCGGCLECLAKQFMHYNPGAKVYRYIPDVVRVKTQEEFHEGPVHD